MRSGYNPTYADIVESIPLYLGIHTFLDRELFIESRIPVLSGTFARGGASSARLCLERIKMLRLLRESTYKGSLIQIYERPCRRREGMECIVLIDWMDVTSHTFISGDPAACESRARQMIDDFCSRRPEPADRRNRTPQHA